LKKQKTIKGEARISGKGLFGGQEVRVVFRPAQEDTGIVFVGAARDEPVRISAIAPNIAAHDRRTTLGCDAVQVDTVEHCLAAIRGLEIDNITIEVFGAELPAPDASAAEYVKVLKRIGRDEQEARAKEFVIKEPISVVRGESSIYALPGSRDHLDVSYDLD